VILVTGGAGYIGSHTVKALRKAGLQALIFDNFSTGHRSFVKSTPCVEGDLDNPADLERAFSYTHIEGVLHFAGKALVPESYRNPDIYYRTNVIGGLHLLDAMRNHGVKHIIFSSSCATYGVPETVPIRENTPQKPINAYGETKLTFERALHWFHQSYGIEYLSLRYFNAAGADMEGEFGEDHDPETHLIPLVFEAALGRRTDVKILGTDYPTPDGTCVRDYIHVADLARAHVMGLQKLMGGELKSQPFNLGTGRGCSVREVVDTVRRITKRDFRVVEASRREGDPPVLVAAVDFVKELVGWTAEVSDLESVVASAWKWHQGRFGRV
jgi:UDP-glucose 4-epimerase